MAIQLRHRCVRTHGYYTGVLEYCMVYRRTGQVRSQVDESKICQGG